MERLRALALLVLVVLALSGCGGPPTPEPRSEAAKTGPEEPEPTMTHGTRDRASGGCRDWVIVDHAFSGSDDTDLVGFADNVFVGRVGERVGSSGPGPLRPFGSTRFRVEVLENVKGRLGGTVTVNQEGSRDPERGCVRLAESDPLLQPGQEVVFFTGFVERRGWHQIVTPGYGDVRIDDGEREELVRRFERARGNQTDPRR